eukprot:ANDGO_01089.mRNA.1 putative MFS-type transporter YusP
MGGAKVGGNDDFRHESAVEYSDPGHTDVDSRSGGAHGAVQNEQEEEQEMSDLLISEYVGAQEIHESSRLASADQCTEDSFDTAVASTTNIADRRHGKKGLNFRLAMAALAISLFLSSMESMCTTTAIPAIVEDLGGADYTGWIVSTYLMASTAIVPLCSKLADYFGRRIVFLSSQIIFLVSSVLCALSNSMTMLIVLRGFQGVGGGCANACVNLVLHDLLAPRERGKYAGLFGMVYAVAAVSGPVIGGFFSDVVSWRLVFWINVPFCLLTCCLILYYKEGSPAHAAPEHTSRQDHDTRCRCPNQLLGFLRSMDLLGCVLLLSGIISVMLLFTWAGIDYAWSSTTIVALLIASLALFAAFFIVEFRVQSPILPPKLFLNRMVSIGSACAFGVGLNLFTSLTYLPVYLHSVLDYSATTAGAAMIPMMVSFVAASLLSGVFMSKTGKYRFLCSFGLFLIAVSNASLTTMSASTRLWMVIIYSIPSGFGTGIVLQVVLPVVQNAVCATDVSPASSAIVIIRSVAGVLGLSLFHSITNGGEYSRLPQGFWLNFACCVVSAIIGLFTPNIPLSTRSPSATQHLKNLTQK